MQTGLDAWWEAAKFLLMAIGFLTLVSAVILLAVYRFSRKQENPFQQADDLVASFSGVTLNDGELAMVYHIAKEARKREQNERLYEKEQEARDENTLSIARKYAETHGDNCSDPDRVYESELEGLRVYRCFSCDVVVYTVLPVKESE